MNTNPLDRAPTLPPGIEPRSFEEMYDVVLERLSEGDPDPSAIMRKRAWRAVDILIDQGFVEWWGLRDGEPTYVPVYASRRTKQTLVYIFPMGG